MLLLMRYTIAYLIFHATFQLSLQNCPEEYSHNGITVKWNQSPNAYNVESDPQCYIHDKPITRNCSDDRWTPAVNEVGPCLKVVKNMNTSSCPPNFYRISESNNEYCYHFDSVGIWDYPCFSSGGATVITDLNEEEINSLIDTLHLVNISRYFWLPAHRPKLFNPVVWAIPGPNWGVTVESNKYLDYHNLIWKNCLALDIEQRVLITDSCSQKYPNLCFYINNIHYPAVCPRKGYHAFRYKPDNGTCYGIETSESGLSFQTFLSKKCKKPMIVDHYNLNRFIFTKIAELNQLPNDEWCWFKMRARESKNDTLSGKTTYYEGVEDIEGAINNLGTIELVNTSFPLFCMACEADVIYGETELIFEYNEVDNQMYLTVYFPSGLWKYDNDDKGIQCFSDAKGFIRVVNINDIPYLSVAKRNDDDNYIEKVVYIVSLISQQSAQYWCEGHTFNFSLISTSKLVVNPKGKETHVFALTIKFYNATYEIDDTARVDTMLIILTNMFNAQKIIWMDVYELNEDFITILLHVHVTVEDKFEDDALNIQETYNTIKEIALTNLISINCSFVSLKSSIYCLPTSTDDAITLNWALTPVGHMSAPNEFCLQSNGLPVKRQCLGSYLNGADWGIVEGSCDFNYTPTETTTFLYNVGIGQAPINETSSFLTEGLEFALSDVDTIIPADIYYLSMSLQQILHIAQKNDSCVEMGDIDNMAWVMDRVMEFDCDYLRLSQTLNSTNVIINSVNDILEIIAMPASNKSNVSLNKNVDTNHVDHVYKIAVKPQYVVQISYPEFTNITGISISRATDSDHFTDMIVQPLYANTTLEDVMKITNLDIAAWLPYKLIKSLKPLSNDSVDSNNNLHIIISVFQNDAVFQELDLTNHIINSRIIGVSVPGFISNFEFPLPIVLRQLSTFRNDKYCSYWDFEMQEPTMTSGSWKTKGCYLVQSIENITVCECYHLTHFSQLISISTSDKYDNSNAIHHTKALNIITLVGSFLSIVGIVGIWVTALVFSNWRKKAGTKVLLQLSTAIALPLFFIVFFNLDNTIFIQDNGNFVVATHMKPVCIILGSLLHYSILASFMWMLITAILQFIRYVRVLGVSRPSRFMIKFGLIGWGIPLIPVITVLSINVESYIPDSSSIKRICYPKEYYFILSVLIPICVILFTNVVLFLLVLYSISGGSNEKTKSTDFDLVGAQLRLSIFLFFLMGLTWIFGIFSFSNNVLWSYLFCLTSTLQGFVLFIYFIICDPTTRNMWLTFMKPSFMSTSSRASITSLG